MKPARIAVIGVALGAGAVAAYLASGTQQTAAPQLVQEAPRTADAEVLVARTDLPLGAKLTDADIRWAAWPKDGLSPGLFVKSEMPDGTGGVVGAIVRTSMLAGEPLHKDRIIKSDGSGFLAAILPSGKRAIAISIDTKGSNTAGTLILPNDRVDVIHISRDWRASKVQGIDIYTSETIIRNVRVLAIGPQIEEKNGERVAVGETATLELDPAQVELVTLAARTGQLTLALRSIVDTSESQTPALQAPAQTALTIVRFGVAAQADIKR